jgi:hypothetical protein
MLMVFVVVLESPQKLRQDGLCNQAIIDESIIKRHGINEGLDHSVPLGQSDRL